jgi:D-serine deaminase-like pyridoxal phosphate-dependent protein
MPKIQATIHDEAGDALDVVVLVDVRADRFGYITTEIESVRAGRRDVAGTLTLHQLAQVEAAVDRRWPQLLRDAELEQAEAGAESRRD